MKDTEVVIDMGLSARIAIVIAEYYKQKSFFSTTHPFILALERYCREVRSENITSLDVLTIYSMAAKLEAQQTNPIDASWHNLLLQILDVNCHNPTHFIFDLEHLLSRSRLTAAFLDNLLSQPNVISLADALQYLSQEKCWTDFFINNVMIHPQPKLAAQNLVKIFKKREPNDSPQEYAALTVNLSSGHVWAAETIHSEGCLTLENLRLIPSLSCSNGGFGDSREYANCYVIYCAIYDRLKYTKLLSADMVNYLLVNKDTLLSRAALVFWQDVNAQAITLEVLENIKKLSTENNSADLIKIYVKNLNKSYSRNNVVALLTNSSEDPASMPTARGIAFFDRLVTNPQPLSLQPAAPTDQAKRAKKQG